MTLACLVRLALPSRTRLLLPCHLLHSMVHPTPPQFPTLPTCNSLSPVHPPSSCLPLCGAHEVCEPDHCLSVEEGRRLRHVVVRTAIHNIGEKTYDYDPPLTDAELKLAHSPAALRVWDKAIAECAQAKTKKDRWPLRYLGPGGTKTWVRVNLLLCAFSFLSLFPLPFYLCLTHQ
jgi:hypothetical protein